MSASAHRPGTSGGICTGAYASWIRSWSWFMGPLMTELNRCAHVLRCCPGAFEFPVGYVRSITRALLLPVGTVGTACIVDFSPTEACSLAPGRSSAGKIPPGSPADGGAARHPRSPTHRSGNVHAGRVARRAGPPAFRVWMGLMSWRALRAGVGVFGEPDGVAEVGVSFKEMDAGHFACVGAGVLEDVQAVADVDGVDQSVADDRVAPEHHFVGPAAQRRVLQGHGGQWVREEEAGLGGVGRVGQVDGLDSAGVPVDEGEIWQRGGVVGGVTGELLGCRVVAGAAAE